MAVTSISEYLGAIEGIAKRYDRHKSHVDLIFRGSSDFRHPLLPGIYRKDKDGGPWFEAPEREILNHFIKTAMRLVNSVDRDDTLTWLTYAQHFGAPTRLLDFSSNPLVSLYFCCKRFPGTDGGVSVVHCGRYAQNMRFVGEPGRRKKHVLDEIMRQVEDPALPCTRYPVTLIPHYIDMRMDVQDSHFLVWGSDTSTFESFAAPYGDMLAEDPDAFHCKIRVDGGAKERLLQDLSALGLNEKRLFPGLDGIGAYVTRFYSQV